MDAPKHIRVLSDEVANKIAAGEVVERPASVLKELLENALDAGATQIEVEVVAGGRKAVAVSDDGCGMSCDDALLSVERHATSKISDVDDLERIATLGFRGEALAAIGSVSRLTLATRLHDALGGTELTVSGGRIQDVKEAGCPPGTAVTVRNLFFNVPARRKFLRSEQTELGHLRQVFLTYALSRPAVALRLVVDGREVHRLASGVSLDERIRALFDAETVRSLRPVEFERGGIRLTGCVGTPRLSRGDRTGQYLFINGRPASAPLLGYAIKEAYHDLLPRERFPVLFLFVEMDPAQVDINVHPTKREVRFRSPQAVRDAAVEGLRRALAAGPAHAEAPPAPPAESRRATAVRIEDIPQPRTFQYPRLPLGGEPEPAPGMPGSDAARQDQGEAAARSPWAWCRIVGQAGGLYVILETEDGVVLMDPHAAHERILYERFMKEVLAGNVCSQGLLTPETVELTPGDAVCVRESMAALKAMGFGLSEFGGDAFMVDALPTCLGSISAAAVLADVARSLEQGGSRGGTEKWSQEGIAQAACHAAVKARDRLTLDEIEQLVIDLARAEMPYTCPHGRPTLIFMSFAELDRKFGRG